MVPSVVVIASTLLSAEQLAPGMAPMACSRCSISLPYVVGRTGFEPVTSSVSGKRSPAELTAREAEAGIEPAYRALQALA